MSRLTSTPSVAVPVMLRRPRDAELIPDWAACYCLTASFAASAVSAGCAHNRCILQSCMCFPVTCRRLARLTSMTPPYYQVRMLHSVQTCLDPSLDSPHTDLMLRPRGVLCHLRRSFVTRLRRVSCPLSAHSECCTRLHLFRSSACFLQCASIWCMLLMPTLYPRTGPESASLVSLEASEQVSTQRSATMLMIHSCFQGSPCAS